MAVVWPSKNDFIDGDVLTAGNVNNIADTLNVFNPTSATNGQVWVANGTGGGAFGTPVSGGWTSLATGTITSGNSSDITGYSMSYKHLAVWIYNISLGTADSITIRPFNTSVLSSGGTMTTNAVRLASTTVDTDGSYFTTANHLQLNFLRNQTNNVTNWIEFYIPDYAASLNRRSCWGWSANVSSTNQYCTSFATSALNRTTAATMSSFRILTGGGATFNSLGYTIWGIN